MRPIDALSPLRGFDRGPVVRQHAVADLVTRNNARPNERDISAQHVHKLGQLVETELSDDLAHAGNMGIFGYFENWAGLLIKLFQISEPLLCIHAYGTELVHCEWFAIFADTLLFEDNRTLRGINLDSYCDDCIQQAEGNEDKNAEKNIEKRLAKR